jgi:hypothetical protein
VERTLSFLAESRSITTVTATTVWWIMDNRNVLSFLAKGSKQMVIMVEIMAVLAKAHSLNFCIQPVWVSRDDPKLQKADLLSKRIDTDNWCIPFSSFIGLFDTFGPFSVDLFATRDNFKVKKFYALSFEPRCSGVDAFVHCWDGEKIYAAPPVSLIIRFIRKLAESKAVSGLLLIPLWK